MRKRPSRRLYSQKKKSTNKKVLNKRILLLAFIVLILAFLIWRIFIFVPKYTVTKSQWYFSELGSARILYESTPIISPNKGTIHTKVENGSEVNEGQNILLVVDSEKEDSLRTRIEEIEIELQQFDLSAIEQTTEQQPVLTETPINDLRGMVRLYGFYQTELRTNEIIQSYKNINDLKLEYFEYINQIENDRIKYESLKEELENLETEYAQCSEECISPNDGVLLFQYDNISKDIKVDELATTYQELVEKEVQKVVINDGDSVDIGDQVGIVVNNDLYHIGIKIPSQIANYLTLADNIELKLDGEVISYEIVDKNPENSLMLISTEENLDISNRDIKIQISTEKLEGFYIPKEAVLEEEMFYVYVYDGRYPVKTEIEILKEHDDKYFVTGLKEDNQIVEDIEEFRR
jgi:hypothetical protein